MEDGLDYTFDDEYTTTLQGYDITIKPSENGDGYFHVVISELGADVYTNELPAPVMQEAMNSEELFQGIAQAAIDFFEAGRGTLGEGAGSDMTAHNKKKACIGLGLGEHRKEWFKGLKGTESEDMAYQLLKSYLDLQYSLSNKSVVVDELYRNQDELLFQLSMLELDYLKNSKPGREVIIISASFKKDAFWSASDLQSFLDQFMGSNRELEAVVMIDKLMDVVDQINLAQKNVDPEWEQLDDLEDQMTALSMDQFQRDLEKNLPSSGMGAFPNMAGEIAQLMEGVEMEAPLEPMMYPMASVRTSAMEGEEDTRKEVYEEWEPVEKRVEELGKAHDGLDPAEMKEAPFKVGDKVSLSKGFDLPGPLSGVRHKFPKGTKGYIDGIYDGHGNSYKVCFDDGRLVLVPVTYLTKKSA